MSNYHFALKASQDRLIFLIEDVNRQIAALDKEIADKERSKQTLLEVRAILRDHGRLIEMDLKK